MKEKKQLFNENYDKLICDRFSTKKKDRTMMFLETMSERKLREEYEEIQKQIKILQAVLQSSSLVDAFGDQDENLDLKDFQDHVFEIDSMLNTAVGLIINPAKNADHVSKEELQSRVKKRKTVLNRISSHYFNSPEWRKEFEKTNSISEEEECG